MTEGGSAAFEEWLQVFPELVGDDPDESVALVRDHLEAMDAIPDGLIDWIRPGDAPPRLPPGPGPVPAARPQGADRLPFDGYIDWVTHDIVEEAAAALRRSPCLDSGGEHVEQIRSIVRGDVALSHLRALLKVMGSRRRDGLLHGDDPFRRYEDFERWISSSDGVEHMVREFPDLVPRARAMARMTTTAVIDDVTRTEAEWPRICAAMGLPADSLIRTISPAGDAHGGGRRVLILHTNHGGAVVLKPRGVALEHGYHQFSSLLGRQVGVAMPSPTSVQGRDAGWSSFVGPPEGREVTVHENYYDMIGVHLASLYLLNGTDVHVENLLNDSLGRPVVIDAEALLAPTLASSDRSTLLRGVRETGLLSLRVGTSDLDLGALEYRAGAMSPLGSWHVVNAGRDDVHLMMRREPVRHPEVLPASGRATTAAAAAVRARFTEAVYWALRHRSEAVAQIQAAFPRGASVRYIHRATMLYAVVQRMGTHPRFARDRDRRRVLGRVALLSPSTDPNLLTVEVSEMMRGDVPLFRVGLDETVVRDSVGRSTGVRLRWSPREQVVSGVEALTEADVVGQLAELDDALAHWTAEPRRR